jgi:hypothetical protein
MRPSRILKKRQAHPADEEAINSRQIIAGRKNLLALAHLARRRPQLMPHNLQAILDQGKALAKAGRTIAGIPVEELRRHASKARKRTSRAAVFRNLIFCGKPPQNR